MWDANANGYARGEGVAVIVLKPLSVALKDGDHIECVVRETGVNQDGATPGITVPDARSQADLIRDTYQKAGLDLAVPANRPQFFEAHGTGTPTGDPIEAEAIQNTMRSKGDDSPPLHVGSIKTVLGHTESTAGVAGVLKAMLALQHSVIPPNMLFTRLNPKVVPFSTGLALPVTAQPWPAVLQGTPRRASVNSFGFGGANGHAIMESWDDPGLRQDTGQLFGPYVFSAGTERALVSVLKLYSDWAASPCGASSNPRDLAWTLGSRRSVHSVRAAFPSSSIAQLKASIDARLTNAAEGASIGVLPLQRQPRILAIFSGQGAQSARMAAELLETSPLAQQTFRELEQSLAQLPIEHRPAWSLTQELLAGESTSRLHLAELAQPLSTAVQILLVDMLRAAGTVFHGTIGHSSGEICSAYAAGFLSAKDAIRIAYYRGLGSKFARSPNGHHIKGAMLAVGTDMEDAEELLQEPEFHGRVCIAASNSSSSITLSGDEEAIAELEDIYEDEKKFRRRLKVDMAYHSAHMQPCADHYVQWLRDCNIQAQEGSRDCSWQSTVYETRNMDHPDSLHALGAEYWADNLTSPVRFSQGLRMALERNEYDIALEIGPHPTLKGPAMQTIKEAGRTAVAYHGTLQRNVNAVHAISTAIGSLWAYHESPETSIRLDDYEKAASGNDDHRLLSGLPSYPWDHSRLHWHSPRSLRKLLGRTDPVHPLLGHADKDSSAHQMRWRHILRTKQIPWLGEHRLQSITVFPAAGYLSSLLEACQIALPSLRKQETTIGLFETTDFVVHRAMVFSDSVEESDEGGIEITVELLDIVCEEENGKGQLRARFVYSAGLDKETGDLSLVASSNVLVHFGPQTSDMLLHIKPPVDRGLEPVDKSVFYDSMAQIGYGYTGSFQGADKLKRSLGKSEAVLGWETLEQQRESGLLVHPAVLDTAIQMLALAYSYPRDGRLWSLFVPVRIDCLRIHLDRYASAGEGLDAEEAPLTMTTVTVNDGDELALAGDADIYAGQYLAIQMQGGKLAPFANASEADDVKMWASMRWAPMDIKSIDLSSGDDQVASAIATLSHRYPRMSILEVGSGNILTMRNVLDRTGLDGLQLYTYTAASDKLLDEVREQLGPRWIKTAHSRVSFRALDPSKDANSQGFHASSFDSIIAKVGLHASDLEKTLRELRVLLRPGGFLVIGVLPIDDALTPNQQERWNTILKSCGFSEIDALTRRGDNGISILVSQAVDDQIGRLRLPISLCDTPAIAEDALLVGGTQALIDELQAILAPHTRSRLHHIASLSSVDSARLASTPIIISLTELDKPLFKNISATEFDNLKALLSLEKTVLWVTRNRRQGNPWANLTTAFLRTARRELPELRIQALDFEGHGEIDATVVAECLLALLLSPQAAIPTPGSGPLLTVEPEIIIDDSGRRLIPRFESMPEADHRYNSARRNVFVDKNPQQTAVALGIDAKSHASFSIVPPRLVSEYRGETIELLSSHSTIRAVHTPVGPRFLSLGVELGSQCTRVWLAESLTSMQHLPIDSATGLPLELRALKPEKLLSLLASELWSTAILDRMQPRQHLLLHNPPAAIASTILRNAAKNGIRVSITCVDKKIARLKSWTHIEAHMPLRDLKKSLSPESISSCIIFGDEESHKNLFLSCIPHHCYVCIVNSAATSGHQSLSNTTSGGVLESILSQAIERVSLRLDSVVVQDEEACAFDVVENIQKLRSADCLAIMQWPQGAVSARTSRFDNAGNRLFPSTKSYWLLGLTSGLGLGICDWMIATGARSIILSSRSGQVETSWLQKHLRNGVTIRVIPCDITSRTAVEQAYTEILSDAALPPLGGVMNGAALFRDRPIREMSLSELNAVLRPKVDGSLHLDSVLGSCPLDFFVMLSSMIGVTGNVGQANYSSANAFMSALATDRRRRGLPGSAISIGAVIGAGYMAREFGDERISAFAEMSGVRACSEVDVHQFLAEAIFGGERDNHGIGDLTREPDLGLAMMGRNDAAFMPSWQTDPTFSRFLPGPNEDEQGTSSQSKSGGTVKDRLQAAMTASDVVAVVSDEVLAKLRGLLQLDSSVDDGSLLRQKSSHMGIDSLIAVELRSWIVKTFQVSIPVLEILEGIATSDLIERVSQQIPEKMVPVLHGVSPVVEPKTATKSLLIKSAASPQADPPNKSETAQAYNTRPADMRADLQGRPRGVSPTENEATNEPTQVPDRLLTGLSIPEHSPSTQAVIRRVDFSFSQATFWFVHSLLKDKTVLNHTTLFRTSGKQIRVESLRAALRAVSGRHEVLRTCVVEHDGKFQQGILEQSRLHLEVHHITRGMAEVQELYLALQGHVFDLANGDVMRILLLTTDSPRESYFITSVHHLVNDSFCMPILLRDIEAAYNTTQHKSRRWDPSSVTQYGAFVVSQQSQWKSGAWNADLAYWTEQFSTIPEPLPLRRARVNSRKPLDDYRVHSIDINLSQDLADRVRRTASANGATAFHFYLAAFRVLLYRMLFQGERSFSSTSMCIGIADAHRTDEAHWESMGPYMALLPLHFPSRQDPQRAGPVPFKSVLEEARVKAFGALAHAAPAFDVILDALRVTRTAEQSPLFQAFVDYRQGWTRKQSLLGTTFDMLEFQPARVPYDLSLDVIDNASSGEGATITLMGQTAVYDSPAVAAFARCYEDILEQAVEKPLFDVESSEWDFREEEIRHALSLGTGDQFQSSWPETLIHQFESVSARKLQKLAIVAADGSLSVSYLQLRDRVARIGQDLEKAGIGAGDRVVVYQYATADQVSSMLAVMAAGAIYVPFDPTQHPGRLQAMLSDCQPSALIVDANTLSAALDFKAPSPVVILNVSAPREVSMPMQSLNIQASPTAPAMIIYTSGTTGTPKGVVLSHASWTSKLEADGVFYKFDSEVVVLQQSACGFDMAILQVFAALAHGGTLCILPQAVRGDSEAVSKAIVEFGVSFTCATPTEYRSWLRHGSQRDLQQSAWSVALSGGEAAVPSLRQAFRDLNKGGLKLYNGYGPTETTYCSSRRLLDYTKPLSEDFGATTAGPPCPNEVIYIVDERMHIMPVGLPGEIVIGGVGVGIGYYGHESQEAFILDNFATATQRGKRMMYRTKDRGRLLPNGELSVEGRIGQDTMIKLRGQRIELQDIEQTIIRSCSGLLSEAVVSARSPAEDSGFLVAHVVFALDDNRDLPVNSEDKKKYLAKLLKELPLSRAMRPSCLIPIDRLPMTVSGKLDRQSVARLPAVISAAAEDEVQDLNIHEHAMREMWMKLLLRPAHDEKEQFQQLDIQLTTDFFHVGGTSMLLMELKSRIRKELHVSLDLIQLFESSTLEAMARLMETAQQQTIANASNEGVTISDDPQIDWEKEARLSEYLEDQLQKPSTPTAMVDGSMSGQVVLLTGAAGGLGAQILRLLLKDDRVAKVICIALRRIDERIASGILPDPGTHYKVKYYSGDLRQQRLGLSPGDYASLSQEITCVLHVAAEVSHAKTYETLRPANVGAMAELVNMCIPRRAAMHMISSAEIGMLGAHGHSGDVARVTLTQSSASSQGIVPSAHDALREGYAASKWVAERLLENAHAAASEPWSISIYRPTGIVPNTTGIFAIVETESGNELDEALSKYYQSSEAGLLQSVLYYSRRLRAVPDVRGVLEGSLNLVGMQNVAHDVVSSALTAGDKTQQQQTIHYRNLAGDSDLEWDQLATYLGGSLSTFETLSLGEWGERAELAGMHPLLVQFFDTARREKRVFRFPKVSRA